MLRKVSQTSRASATAAVDFGQKPRTDDDQQQAMYYQREEHHLDYASISDAEPHERQVGGSDHISDILNISNCYILISQKKFSDFHHKIRKSSSIAHFCLFF